MEITEEKVMKLVKEVVAMAYAAGRGCEFDNPEDLFNKEEIDFILVDIENSLYELKNK